MPAYLISYDCDGEPIALRVSQEPAEGRAVAALKRIERQIHVGGRSRLSETSLSPVKTAPSDGYFPVAA